MPPATATPPAPVQAFADELATSLDSERFVKAALAGYRGPETDLLRVDLRRVRVREQPQLQLVFHHATRDITRNLGFDEGVATVRSLLGAGGFRNGHLRTLDGLTELTITKRGHARLHRSAQPIAEPPPDGDSHDRRKHRWLSIDRPFLVELGVTTPEHRLIPSMARKWKQINRFIEVFAGALASSTLAQSRQLRILDFGCGKGYLSFALHDWLRHVRQVDAQVTGVELRPDLVTQGNEVIARLGLEGMRFDRGDLRSWPPTRAEVVIALHACDTATDHAIDLAIRGGAEIILCAPCCHKQLRPQLLQPHPLRPVLQHGVHQAQEAEMLTDSLRALLLEAAGYDAQVFEFISLEHTQKNKMILAVRRAQPRPLAPLLAQVAELKAFYGIREQCLETLLKDRWPALAEPSAPAATRP